MRTAETFGNSESEQVVYSQRVLWTTVENPKPVAAGLITAAFAALLVGWYRHGGAVAPDFDIFYQAAVALRTGHNPYAVHGDFPLYYPLPAIVPLLPLTLLSVTSAHVVFAALSAFALGYAIADRPWLWVMLLSQSFLASVMSGQWSTLLLAAFFLPAVRAFTIVKPNVGVALAASSTSKLDLWWTLGGAAVFSSVAFALFPAWPAAWLESVRGSAVHRSALLMPGGFLLLAAALRWRRPEARWLLALAIVPQSPGLYTDLLSFAIPRTKWEVVALTCLSYVPLMIADALPRESMVAEIARYGTLTVPLLYLPCLAMILRRPNEGSAVAWRAPFARHRPVPS